MAERWWALPAVYALLFLSVVLPVSVGWRASEASWDENRCYLPAISQLNAKFPRVDLLGDSLSASPPGYSHLLAGLSRVTGDTLVAHRAWHAVLSLAGALFLLCLVAHLTQSGSLAVAAMLPMLCSGYYLKSSAQLTTDNPSLVLSFAALSLVFFGKNLPRHALSSGLLGAASVWVRHISVWTAVPMFLKSVLSAIDLRPRLVVAWLMAVAAVVLPVVVFFCAWGGLVPPRWVQATGGFSLSSVAYVFSLAGVFGGVFLYAGNTGRLGRSDLLAGFSGGACGLFLFLLAATNPSYEAGRFGGPLWSLAGKLPVIGERSLVFLPLVIVGAAALGVAGRRLYARSPDRALLWIAALTAWLATGIANRQIFHRYYEGPMLGFWGLWLLLMAAGNSAGTGSPRRWPLYLLSSFLFAAGAYSVFYSPTGFVSPLKDSLLSQ